ncbi:LptF/LptG family permease [Halarcobacter anaerophilus]|jgi:lipopolysaccharide export system permease protein|uniref:Permease n=1 Tax=Halarcobacter anaerophilus TaxID=877500 RepID=A0A4Q0XWJ0_9BACT|nr:LptF/LptG family permease [Halarcobacter anaerophilus]QDF28357.1 lipooligosaccharide transport system, ABC transporter permease component LptG [Halarcobacter anaerophilus]RXJ61980.1 permease [Halarcobacter anaerophilus]
MSIITKYILRKYLVNFIIVLISLELFFVGMDFLQNLSKLPGSANLQLLYLMYNSFFTLTLTLPLSLVFGWILTLVLFVRNNELIAFNSLGATKVNIYLPVMIISTLLLIILISIQMTPMAYSYEQKKKILDGNYFTNTKSDIFLKYDDNFVYFKKLLPLKKQAEGIHIYKVKDEDIVETIIAKKAYFQNNKWYVVDAKVVKKPKYMDFENSKLEVRYEKFLNTLDGFKPKILDNVYDDKSTFSILDAISALSLLAKQDISTDKIRAAIYYNILIPFFILPMMMLIFAFVSSNRRFFNMGSFTSFSIFSTLVVWGIFFMLHKFSNSGVMRPEFSLLIPMALWYVVSYFIYKKRSRVL